MSHKRPSSEMEGTTSRPRRMSSKRIKLIPAEEASENSSEPSSCSVSVASALGSSPGAVEQREHQSSVSSVSADSDADSESSLSSSSEEPSDDDDGDTERIVTIGGPKKPAFKPASELATGVGNLQARLSALLPRLQDANALLERDGGKSFSMEEVDEGEQYIEMDLGLGVLEEQDGSDSDDSSDEDDDGWGEEEKPVFSEAVSSAQEPLEGDVMGKLMGRKRGEQQEVGIEEVEL